MSEFFELMWEGLRLAGNLGRAGADRARTGADRARTEVLAYFRQVRTWTIRFAIAAAAPLVVILPLLFFGQAFGGLYGAYVVWVVLLAAAELLLLGPMYMVWRALHASLPDVARALQDWLEFIRSVVFNGLSLGIFVAVFPVWRSPGAFPLLLLVLACWVTLPMSGVSKFFKTIYPAVRAVQLLILSAVLLMQMAFPRHMEQLGWATSQAVGRALSVDQRDITAEWENITWFSNTDEALVWYSGSDAEGYRLWAAPGFDQHTREKLRAVSDPRTRDAIIADLRDRDRLARAAQALAVEEQRRRDEAARAITAGEERRQAEAARALAEAQRASDRRAQGLGAERASAQRRASYLYANSLPNKVDLIVSVELVPRRPMDGFSTSLVRYLRSRGKTASNIVFSSEFVPSGAFDSFFRGRGGADIRNMPMSAMGDRLLLARVTINSVRQGTTAAGLITASVGVAFSVLSANDGSVVDGFSVSANGAGTSEAGAISAALDRVLDQLSQHGY